MPNDHTNLIRRTFQGLQNIKDTWEALPITMIPYKEKGIYKLKTISNVMQALENHQVQLSSMKSTRCITLAKPIVAFTYLMTLNKSGVLDFPRYVEPFSQEVEYWERTLSTIGEVLEMLLVVQRNYTYLDNIFTAEDIRKQLPKETDDFDKVTSELAEHTSRMASHGLALPATHIPRMCHQRDKFQRRNLFIIIHKIYLTEFFKRTCTDCVFFRVRTNKNLMSVAR